MERILFIFLLFSSFAMAEQPRLSTTALFCNDINWGNMKLFPTKAENVESAYCGYLVGFYDGPIPTYFSTQENADGYISWRNRRCKENQLTTLGILKQNHPDFIINCSRYYNFDNAMDKANLNTKKTP